jgi:hypothetical protein
MITLYRAVSKAEKEDFDTDGQFRLGRNTLEVKQFFLSEEAMGMYIKKAQKQGYYPFYKYLLHVNIDKECLENISYIEQELDGFFAITIYEDDLFSFNKCIKFVEYYDIRN